MMHGSFPSGFPPPSEDSPQPGLVSPPSASDNEKYLSELLSERQKLSPFIQVLPNCSRLLNHEIVRVKAVVGHSTYMESDVFETPQPQRHQPPMAGGAGPGSLAGAGPGPGPGAGAVLMELHGQPAPLHHLGLGILSRTPSNQIPSLPPVVQSPFDSNTWAPLPSEIGSSPSLFLPTPSTPNPPPAAVRWSQQQLRQQQQQAQQQQQQAQQQAQQQQQKQQQQQQKQQQRQHQPQSQAPLAAPSQQARQQHHMSQQSLSAQAQPQQTLQQSRSTPSLLTQNLALPPQPPAAQALALPPQAPSSQPLSLSPSPLPLATGSVAPVVKRTRRLEVPVDQYPNFNFVGRILGPRGNSLKRVESQTGCRVLIRGRGSIKDPAKEEKLRDKPGYEHLREPLHVIVEAELPADVCEMHVHQACDILQELLKPVEESQDIVKKLQLRELAILNGTLREESPSPSMPLQSQQRSSSFRTGSPSPSPSASSTSMTDASMKRPKTRR